MKKKVISLGAAALMFFAGISAIPMDVFAIGNTAVDYSESVYSLPVDIQYVSDIEAIDSGVVMLGGDVDAKTLYRYESTDMGDTWIKGEDYLNLIPVDISQAEAVDSYGYISKDGYVGIYVGIEGDNESLTNYNFIVSPEGNVTTLFTPDMGDNTYYKMYFAGDNVYMEDIRGNMVVADKKSGSITGRVMENTDFLLAEVATNGDEIIAVSNSEVDRAYPMEYKVDNAYGKQDELYVIDVEGISTYSEKYGKQLIYKNKNDAVNRNTEIEVMEVLPDGSILAAIWDVAEEDEKIVKYTLK